MVKYFKYIFFGLICFICFIGSSYAVTKCTYYYDIYDAGAYEEGHRIQIDIEYKELVNLYVNDKKLEIHTFSKKYDTNYFPKITYKSGDVSIDYYLSLGDFSLKNGEELNSEFETCPNLKVTSRDITFKNDETGVLLTIYRDNSTLGEEELKTKIDTVLGEETTYQVNFNRCDATTKDSETSEKCDDLIGGQQGSIYIKVSKDGTYKIGMNNEYNAINENNENVWEGTYMYRKFVIRQSEWSQIKSEFVFNSSITEDISKSLVITPKDNYYVISLDGISDGDGEETEARGDTSILDDDRYNFTIIYKNVSDKVGTCVDYLGHADGKENGEPTVAYYLQMAFNLVKVGSIVLCIVFSMLDFSAAITSAKTDVNKTAIKCVKRLVVVIVLLLLPTFIDMLGSIVGVEDILCGIK